jgi:hypothetical protein
MTTHDGGNTGGAAQSAISTVAFSIAAINDAPVLADTILSLTAVAQNSPNPAGAVGNTVASLLGGASDVDASALQGIAITGVNANGKLWYSTDGGTSWTENSTALSAGNALLLTADADNRVYFAPNADFEGIVSDALSFRAWDQTSGTQGSFVSTTTNGTTTAFSSHHRHGVGGQPAGHQRSDSTDRHGRSRCQRVAQHQRHHAQRDRRC